MTTHSTLNPAGPPAVARGSGSPQGLAGHQVLRLLADPLRARLVTLLSQEQLCTCHLADATGALPTAVSNHLRRLREAGVVERDVSGRYTYYRVRPEMLDDLGSRFCELATAARAAEQRAC